MENQFDVIVVGGGLAGLAAGVTAALDGARTVVLEAHTPGGRARTTERDGFVLNQGVHALFTGGAGMDVLKALGVTPRGAPPPMDRYLLVADGIQHVLPLDPETVAQTTYLDTVEKEQFIALGERIARLDPAPLAGIS